MSSNFKYMSIVYPYIAQVMKIYPPLIFNPTHTLMMKKNGSLPHIPLHLHPQLVS